MLYKETGMLYIGSRMLYTESEKLEDQEFCIKDQECYTNDHNRKSEKVWSFTKPPTKLFPFFPCQKFFALELPSCSETLKFSPNMEFRMICLG